MACVGWGQVERDVVFVVQLAQEQRLGRRDVERIAIVKWVFLNKLILLLIAVVAFGDALTAWSGVGWTIALLSSAIFVYVRSKPTPQPADVASDDVELASLVSPNFNPADPARNPTAELRSEAVDV